MTMTNEAASDIENPTVAYNTIETRRRLGCISHPTLYKLIGLGLLRPTKIGRRTVFTDKAIADCLRKATK